MGGKRRTKIKSVITRKMKRTEIKKRAERGTAVGEKGQESLKNTCRAANNNHNAFI